MQSVLFLAFESHSGAAHLRHTEGIISLDTQHLFNTATLFFRMRFGTDNQSMQLGIPFRVNPHLFHHLIQSAGIAGNSMQGRGSEIGDELDLSLGVSCSRRHRKHAQPLGTVLESQSAGKHTITR